MARHIVKRHGTEQKYDEKKVYASVYASALNCHLEEQEAEQIAEDVMKKINAWMKSREFTRSEDIRDSIITLLKRDHHKDIALMYKHHLDLS